MKGIPLKFLFRIQVYLNITCLILKRKIYIWGTSKDKIKSCLEIIYVIKFTSTLKTNGNVLLYSYFHTICFVYLSWYYYIFTLFSKVIRFLNLKKCKWILLILLDWSFVHTLYTYSSFNTCFFVQTYISCGWFYIFPRNKREIFEYNKIFLFLWK